MSKVKEGKKVNKEESLLKYVVELEGRCESYRKRLSELQDYYLFRRIDYLFKVVELRDRFPASFVDESVNELISHLSLVNRSVGDNVDSDGVKAE